MSNDIIGVDNTAVPVRAGHFPLRFTPDQLRGRRLTPLNQCSASDRGCMPHVITLSGNTLEVNATLRRANRSKGLGYTADNGADELEHYRVESHKDIARYPLAEYDAS